MFRAGKICLGAALALSTASLSAAAAQELSDKSVAVLMDYAWSLVPAQFSQPDGKVIVTDKKNREASTVPMDVAKEVIRVGRMSAHAQICEMPDEQKRNHAEMMRREVEKKTWSPQQMLYINQLHLVTVMMLTGNVKVTEKEGGGGKDVAIEDATKAPAKTCTEEEKAKIKSVIATYIASAAAAAPAAAAAAPAAAPVAAAAEKK